MGAAAAKQNTCYDIFTPGLYVNHFKEEVYFDRKIKRIQFEQRFKKMVGISKTILIKNVAARINQFVWFFHRKKKWYVAVIFEKIEDYA